MKKIKIKIKSKCSILIDDCANPVEIVGNPRVYTGNSGLAAADSPRNDAGELPLAVSFAHHRAAPVALARVLALLAARADESRVEIETRTESGPSHLVLAHLVAHHGYVDLLQDVLVLSEISKSILSPSGRPASDVREKSLLLFFFHLSK